MFDRETLAEQAILVHVFFPQESACEDLHELQMLVSSAGVSELAVVSCSRSSIDARLFIGSGKALEVAQQVADLAATVVIFNHALSPAQTRNLERLCLGIRRPLRSLDTTGRFRFALDRFEE